jgi:hypothetical protein
MNKLTKFSLLLAVLLSSCIINVKGNDTNNGNNNDFKENFEGGLSQVLGLPSEAIDPSRPSQSGNNYTFYLVKGVIVLNSMYAYHNDPVLGEAAGGRYTLNYIKSELADKTEHQYRVYVKGQIFRYVWDDINFLDDTYRPFIEKALTNPEEEQELINSGFLALWNNFNDLINNPDYAQFIPQRSK